MATTPKQFQQLTRRIPKDLKNVWFFPLKAFNKSPDVPAGTILLNNPEYRLNPHYALKRLYNGRNVGCYAMPGGLMFLDVDVKDGKIKASKEFIDKITPTFTVRTRNGGLHYYYLNDGLWANQKIVVDGVTIGELRTNWQYVVSAGSYVEPDKINNAGGTGIYQVIQDSPIVPFSNAGLEQYIQKGTAVKENKIVYEKRSQANHTGTLKEYQQRLKDQGKVHVLRERLL